jgi:N-acyl-D-aspartate/D-glutamate deacylase
MGAAGTGVFEVASDLYPPEPEFEWMAELSRRSGRPVTFACLQGDHDPEGWRQLLALAEEANATGAHLVPQVAGRPASILFGWEGTAHPFIFHSAYQPLAHLSPQERVERLRDPEVREAIVSQDLSEGPIGRFLNNWPKIYPLGDPPDYEPGPDKSVAAIAEREGRTPAEVTYDLLMERDGRALLYFPAIGYADGDFEALREMLERPESVLGLGDGGAHCGIICDASLPSYMLTHWVRDRDRGDRLPLEYVVRSQTRSTAELFGFLDRGLLAPGYLADVNVIDFDGLRLSPPEMVYDLPAGGRRLIQKAHGYTATIKRGVVTLEGDEPTGERPGVLLRGEQALS